MPPYVDFRVSSSSPVGTCFSYRESTVVSAAGDFAAAFFFERVSAIPLPFFTKCT